MPTGISSISAISSNGRPRCTWSTTTVRCARDNRVNPRSSRSRSRDLRRRVDDCRVVTEESKRDDGPATARLGVTRVHDEPVGPCVEPLRVPERRQLAPGDGQCLLCGVLGECRVAKDPVRNGDEAIDGRGHESGERLLVTSLCSSHQVGLHRPPLGREDRLSPLLSSMRGGDANPFNASRDQPSSRRMIGRGGVVSSHERSSATVNPARSNIAWVPTYAALLATLPRLSCSGYPSSVFAPCARA